MGLISKYVEVSLGGKNIKYYEDLGYKIPRVKGRWGIQTPKGTKITVLTTDLKPNSKIQIDVECDNCGKRSHIKYNSYYTHNHNGKTYCHKCANQLFNRGENNCNWNPNKTDEERLNGRRYPEYMEFVKRVLIRDQFTCQVCGEKQGEMDAHHLDGYEWCIEKRTDTTNGITLCENCHKAFHALYGYGNNTKEQFEEWYGQSIELLQFNDNLCPTKQVYCIETNTVYNSVLETAIALNIKSRDNIYSVCNKKAKSVLGYHFLWYTEYIKMTEDEIKKYLEYCNTRTQNKNNKAPLNDGVLLFNER